MAALIQGRGYRLLWSSRYAATRMADRVVHLRAQLRDAALVVKRVTFLFALIDDRNVDAGVEKRPYQFEQPLIGDSFRDARHQDVVVDSIEELLQIDVHHPAVAFGQIFLYLSHRLMCRAAGAESVAAL